MAGSKQCVSAQLEPETMAQLDNFCARLHRTRSEVVRGLLYALLVEGKQGIFDEWRQACK